MTELTIGIPTCARPRKIKACIQSLRAHIDQPYRLLVVDSGLTDESEAFYRTCPDLELVVRDAPIGPSEARRIIGDRTETPLLLYLDDDNEVTPNAVGVLRQILDTQTDLDIVAGAWNEYGQYRPLGQTFHFGRTAQGSLVYKSFLSREDAMAAHARFFRVDAALATMLLRRSVLDRVQFDPQYDFYFELFDFFMQCHRERVAVAVTPHAEFLHNPIRYRRATRRQTQDRERDRRRFTEKWGVVPLEQPWRFRRPFVRRVRYWLASWLD